MLGTVVNALAILAGGGFGLLLRRGLPARIEQTVMHALALAILVIGLAGALQGQETLLMIVSLVLGGIAGEALRIEERVQALGDWVERRFCREGGGVANAFVTTSLVVCVGSMAIVGSLEAGMTGNCQTLFAKAVLDGVLCAMFAAAMGPGVLLAAVPIFVYQGAITLCAGLLRPLFSSEAVGAVSAVGGVLVFAIGVNLLGVLGEKKIRIGNLLPAVFVPLLWFAVRGLF